jgi:Uma2 family endonuclease
MSTAHAAVVPLDPRFVRGLRRVEYDALAETGAFDSERVELLYGMVVTMTPKGPPHESAVDRLNELLLLAFRGHARVRVGSPIAASDRSEPEPDIAVVPLGDYERAHPTEAYMVVEVSSSSLALDLGAKAQLYAETGIPVYWVVNLVDDVLEVRTDIVRGAYTRVTPFRRGERVTLPRLTDVTVLVDDVLPPLR